MRDRRNAKSNPYAQVKGDFEVDEAARRALPRVAAAQARLRADLRRRVGDGDRGRRPSRGKLCKRPAWIRGIAHIVEPQELGVRDLTRSRSTEIAAEKAGRRQGRHRRRRALRRRSRTRSILVERALGARRRT